jgi:hypothetical protein
MVEIKKAVVVLDNKGQTYLMAVAEDQREALNIKVKYDYDQVDFRLFFSDLKEAIARDMDVRLSAVEINEKEIMETLRSFNMLQAGVVLPKSLH